MRPLAVLLAGVLLVHAPAMAASPPAPPLAATPPAERNLEDLQARQTIGVALLAGLSKALPQLLWFRQIHLDARAVTLAGSAWSSTTINELVENLGKTRIAAFGPPKLASAKAAEDGYDAFSITLDYVAPPAGPAGGEILRRVATREERGKLEARLQTEMKILLLTPLDFRTGNRGVPNGPVELWSVSLRIEKATYPQIGMLLERWSRLDRLVVLEELHMESADKDKPEWTTRIRLSLPTVR